MKYEEGMIQIINGLKEYEGFYSKDYYLEFDAKSQGMREKIQESLQEGRLLKIGIVGEMKAGKSSFLNSLIFDGEDLLPKASTPMTAALTKISYAEKDSAKIVFYSKKDWERVEAFADEYDKCLDSEYNQYLSQMAENNMLLDVPQPLMSKEEYRNCCNEGIPIQYRSCHELVELSEKSSLDVYECLEEKERNISCTNLAKELDEYIGANGKYTAVVKHVELGMKNELLQGIEIIDTPGMNDPIVSRGETTKKFLQNCDVVFLLSYCGQFLTQEDISFMTETLPREGVKNIVIIGSKFDSGILDNSKFNEFSKAVAYSKKLYDTQATSNIDKCLSADNNRESILKIKESLPPFYISSLMYDVAKKNRNGISLEANEKNIIEQCKKRFEGFSEEEQFLLKLSGIGKVRSKKLKQIKEQKDSIISERNKTIVEDSKSSLLRIIGQIKTQVQDNYSKVKNGDVDKLEKQLQDVEINLNNMRSVVNGIFEKYKLEASRILNSMEVEIDLEILNHTSINVASDSHMEYHTVKTGIFKKEVIQENVVTKSASVSDAISNMRAYIVRCKKMTNDTFASAINIGKLKNDIKTEVLKSFEVSKHEFNENDILIPLEIVVGKVSIPSIEIDMDSYENMIVDSFNKAVVSGEEIETLRLEMNRTMTKIAEKLKKEIKKCRRATEILMEEQSNVFVDNIINTLSDNVKMIKNRIKDKEESIKKYEKLSEMLLEYTTIIKQLEM